MKRRSFLIGAAASLTLPWLGGDISTPVSPLDAEVYGRSPAMDALPHIKALNDAFVSQYAADVHRLMEQRPSRLREFVKVRA